MNIPHVAAGDAVPDLDLRQADVIDCPQITMSATRSLKRGRLAQLFGPKTKFVKTPLGVVVVSQTCDLVRPDPPYVAVAPVVTLVGDEAVAARSGRQSRFVPLPAIDANAFADLALIGSVMKSEINELLPRRGMLDTSQERRFRQSVGRRYSRFPFPDQIGFWVRPLERLSREKIKKNSEEGDVFRQVSQLRLECAGDWYAPPPYELMLTVVLPPGALPPANSGEFYEPAPGLVNEIRPGNRLASVNELGRLLVTKDRGDLPEIWSAIAESWAAECKPRQQDLRFLSDAAAQAVMGCVAGGAIGSEALTEDDYTLRRYFRSEQLDVDDLSARI